MATAPLLFNWGRAGSSLAVRVLESAFELDYFWLLCREFALEICDVPTAFACDPPLSDVGLRLLPLVTLRLKTLLFRSSALT